MRRIDEVLNRFLDRIGQSEGAAYVGMFRGWRRIVGDRIADHAEPVDIRAHALVVEADHPGWVQMIMMERRRILRQIAREFPELTITALHIRVAGDKSRKSTEIADQSAEGPESRAKDTEILERPPAADDESALERIEDTELRSSLERLRRNLD